MFCVSGIFYFFILVEAGEESVIHVWINITLGRDHERAGEETTRTPVSQGLAEIWDGLGNVTGCGLG